MNNAEIKKLNKITFIMNLVVDGFEIKLLKPHIEHFISLPENHPLLLEVYDKIEKVVKE